MAHALLSPSSASRWLECPPSARLEADRPDKAGEAADEGTLAHKLSELMLNYELKRINKADYKARLAAIEKNKFYSDSMWEYCDQFKTFIIEKYNEAIAKYGSAVILLEEEVDLTEWIPEGFGTRDVAIISDHILDVIDLKYGKGVHVDATNNKQMMLYGLGTLEEYDMLYDIIKVRLTIYQPRIDNFSTWEISADELRNWSKKELIPIAQLAWSGKGDFKPGKHCQFCKIKTTCKANADYQMGLAVYEFENPVELSDTDLADIFKRAAAFKNWINEVESYMLQEALKGKKWPELKLVTGRSNRVLTQQDKIKAIFEKNKIKYSLYMSEPTLLGITALEKNITKAKVNSLIGKYILKPDGKPALTDINDSRPEYHSNEAAAKDFE